MSAVVATLVGVLSVVCLAAGLVCLAAGLAALMTVFMFAPLLIGSALEQRNRRRVRAALGEGGRRQIGEAWVWTVGGSLALKHPRIAPSLDFRTGPGGRTGDWEFDSVVSVPPAALPAFWIAADADTRAQLRVFVRDGLSLSGGEMLMPLRDPARLERQIRRMVDLANRLAVSEPWLDRAVDRALRDPSPGVRAQVGRWLAAGPGVPAEAHRLLLESWDPETVLLSAKALDDRPTLVRLLDDPTVRARAAAAMARGLEPGADPALEEYLISQLPALSVIAALADMGTVAAVPALRDAQGLALTEAGRRARDAVRSIQARAAPSRGTVALADEGGGGLSTADEHGGLSVAARAEARPPR